MVGISDDYIAYCLDEAVLYFGMTVEAELEKAGHRPGKEERKAQRAREAVLDRFLNDEQDEKKGSGFADPAVLFQ